MQENHGQGQSGNGITPPLCHHTPRRTQTHGCKAGCKIVLSKRSEHCSSSGDGTLFNLDKNKLRNEKKLVLPKKKFFDTTIDALSTIILRLTKSMWFLKSRFHIFIIFLHPFPPECRFYILSLFAQQTLLHKESENGMGTKNK